MRKFFGAVVGVVVEVVCKVVSILSRLWFRGLPPFFAAAAVSAVAVVAAAATLGGCMFVPVLADDEDSNANTADTRLEQRQAEQMERMRRNPNISSEEYNAMNSRAGNPGGLPPRPESAEALEKRLEAEGERNRR